MSEQKKRNVLWWVCIVGLAMLFLAAGGTFAYGVVTRRPQFWIGGLVAMGGVVGGCITLYGHTRDPKP
ncbi:MAG: hypothetical protein M3323_08255 [Actinomycetota bacterium]|nr:hypothetical protein [Actinomycetota bacterium]